ncbi:hypothetical protein KM043_001746 [Ampulex compressa]|nr:hypothetical protein KM043_001746 [Ampulex compressa]
MTDDEATRGPRCSLSSTPPPPHSISTDRSTPSLALEERRERKERAGYSPRSRGRLSFLAAARTSETLKFSELKSGSKMPEDAEAALRERTSLPIKAGFENRFAHSAARRALRGQRSEATRVSSNDDAFPDSSRASRVSKGSEFSSADDDNGFR